MISLKLHLGSLQQVARKREAKKKIIAFRDGAGKGPDEANPANEGIRAETGLRSESRRPAASRDGGRAARSEPPPERRARVQRPQPWRRWLGPASQADR